MLVDGAFNSCGGRTTLADFDYGNPVPIKDIFLASRLASEGLITVPVGSAWGFNASQQYFAQLANAYVAIRSDYEELGFTITTAYRTEFFWRGYPFELNFTIPVKEVRESDLIGFIGGRILPTQTLDVPVSNWSQFATDFNTEFTDFFVRGILEQKDLTYKPIQRLFGLSDISLAANLTVDDLIPCTDLNLSIWTSFPTAPQATQLVVNEIVLGQDGAQLATFGLATRTTTQRSFINPTVSFAVTISSRFGAWLRASKLKDNIDEVFFPPSFTNAQLTPGSSFSYFDSASSTFADQRVWTQIRYGTVVTLTVGDTFIADAMDTCEMNMAYQFTWHDNATLTFPNDGNTYDASTQNYLFEQKIHMLIWSFTYTPVQAWQFSGSVNVVAAGTNTPRYHQWNVGVQINF